MSEMKKSDVVFFCGAKHKNGEFSNGYLVDFEVNGNRYNSVTQYVMSQKALIFRDIRAFNAILNSKDPDEMKRLGDMVEGFDRERWNGVEMRAMRRAVRAKFEQNPAMRECLMATGEKLLAQADPRDRVLGIGYSRSDAAVMDRMDSWGQNLLGKCLMELRSELAS